MTLSEVNPKFIQQADPGLQKRWFADEEIDLTIWQEEDGRVVHFQFVLHGNELVEWDEYRGLRTGVLHDTEVTGAPKGSRTYVLRSARDERLLGTAIQEFERQGAELEPKIKAFVKDALTGTLPPPTGKVVRLRSLKPPPAEPAPSHVETRVVSLGLMSPRGIRELLSSLSTKGWELSALGGNIAVFQRDTGKPIPDISYEVRSITLKLPHQIQSLVSTRGRQGEIVSGIGSNYVFFKRIRNKPPEPRELRLDWIWLLTAGRLQAKIEKLAADGWRLTGMGRQFAVFERPLDELGRWRWLHKSVPCPMFASLTGAGETISRLVDTEAAAGWRPCAIHNGRLYLQRPA